MIFKLASLFLFIFTTCEAVADCQVFPKENIWNTSITGAPIHKSSKIWLASINTKTKLHPDFGAGTYKGRPIGIPINYVSNNTQKHYVKFKYKTESDHQKYPIPFKVKIEGGENSTGDRHIITLNTESCILYELFHAYLLENNQWSAASGAIFNLSSNMLRPKGWTSADAAGLPIYPGLVKYQEVKTGEVNHAFRFTIKKTNKSYLWPARHFASKHNNPNLPPMGIRLRLKQNIDITRFSPQAKTIATTLKTYGMILADNGGDLFLSGEPNKNWNNKQLKDLKKLTISDFEVVDVETLKVTENSALTLKVF